MRAGVCDGQDRCGKARAGRRRPLRVLLVEDQASERALLQASLHEAAPPVQVVACASGAAAIARLQVDAGFDCIVLDLMMPGMDGRETLRRIRGDLGVDVPVVVLSATDAEPQVVQAFQAGADVYVVKSMLSAPRGLGGFLEDFLDARAPD